MLGGEVKAEVRYTGTVMTTPADGDQDPHVTIERFFDDTMAELVKLGAEDPAVDGSIASGDVEISLVVEGASFASLVQSAETMIRAAFHAAGLERATRDDLLPDVQVNWIKVEADELLPA